MSKDPQNTGSRIISLSGPTFSITPFIRRVQISISDRVVNIFIFHSRNDSFQEVYKTIHTPRSSDTFFLPFTAEARNIKLTGLEDENIYFWLNHEDTLTARMETELGWGGNGDIYPILSSTRPMNCLCGTKGNCVAMSVLQVPEAKLRRRSVQSPIPAYHNISGSHD